MKAIFVSSIDYESPIQIGDHQLARKFATHGWKVAFLSLPITPFHLFSKNKNAIRRRMKSYLSAGYHYDIGSGKLWSYVPGAFLIPNNTKIINHRFIYENWQKTIFPSLINTLKKNGFGSVSLIHIRDPLQGFILSDIDHSYSLFRLADNDTGFSAYNDNYKKIEKRIAQSVDTILYTSRCLEDYIKELDPIQSNFLPNGVDNDFFEKADKSRPIEYQNIHNPIVVYAGSIDYWFDFDLVNQLVRDIPDLTFVIIGPNEKYANKFIPQKNLFLLGQIPHDQLPRYLYNAKIGFIPFNTDKFPILVNAISPIKLYEYMACGLPVVSSRWNELEKLKSPAILCSNYDEFKSGLSKVLDVKIDQLDTKAFASVNDWNYRYQEILRIIQQNDTM